MPSPYAPAQAAPAAADLERARRLLQSAERPLAIVGGQPWSAAAGEDLAAWCEASGIPVAAAWRCQDYVDNEASCYAGHLAIGADPALRARLRDADVLLVVGARLGDIETAGYTTIVPPGGGRALIHVHPDPDEIGRVYEPDGRDRRIRATLRRVPRAARAARRERAGRAPDRGARRLPGDARGAAAPRRGRDDGGDGSASRAPRARRDPDERRRQLHRLGASLLRVPALPDAARAALRRDGIRPPRRDRGEARPSRPGRRLPRRRRRLPHDRAGARDRAPGGCPGRRARRRQRDVRDDPHAPGAALPRSRPSGTDLANPDFVALAQRVRRVRRSASSGRRTSRTRSTAPSAPGRPAVLHLPVDPEALTPRQTLSEIRSEAGGGAGAG